MRQSALFTKARREAPADEVAKNAQLLIRAGYIHKEMAGVYDYLPLGLRVLNKLIGIIREEMNAIGGEEVFLASLQEPALWAKTGRWQDDAIDVWFKSKLKSGTDIGLATTHEEPLTAMMREHLSSYKDLPRYVYQFQTKFRNELRVKSGLLRSREFVMKDLYSFSRDEAEFKDFYERCAGAYLKIFARAGVGEKTYRTFASGASFSTFSDEFQTECAAGEDTIYIDDAKRIAVNKEVYTEEALAELGLRKDGLREVKAIEVGNIFPLGTKYSTALGLAYKNEKGEDVPVWMGSYGLGPGRLMGTIVEMFADEKGLVWPEAVAPFKYHLVSLGRPGDEVSKAAEVLYNELTKRSVEVLYDDRDLRAGEKFAESDLLGIPWRIVVGKVAMESGAFEVVERASGSVSKKSHGEIL